MKSPGYKLKEFARITNLSRKALLLYEKKRLLVPELIDEKTGYRYYSNKQIRRAAQLAFLRNLDISLDDMAAVMDHRVSLKQYFESSRKRLELLKQQIKIHHGLQAIQMSEYNEYFLNNSIEVSAVPQMVVLSQEGRGGIRDISLYYSLLHRFMHQNSICPNSSSFTYYYRDSNPQKLHFKICFPLSHFITIQHPDIRCELFQSVKIAYMYHFGDYDTLNTTYSELNESMKNREWKCTGEYMETYIISGDKKYTDSSSFVTSVAGILE